MKNIVQISKELRGKISNVKTDDDLVNLGFKCEGMLSKYNNFDKENERLWLWSNVKENDINVVVTYDLGNTNCSIHLLDVYVNEIINKYNI